MQTLVRSIRLAARRLHHARGFTIVAVLTLAAGLGASSALFALVNTILLKPLPYRQPDRLVSISHTLVVGGQLRVEQSDASLLFFQRHNRVFAAFGGYQPMAAALAAVGGTAGDAERIPAARVTAGVLEALAVPPLRGRLLTAGDDEQGAPPVAVLGELLWRRKYGADPGVLNRQLTIDGVPHEIVGIVPASVHFPSPETALWVPLRLDAARTDSSTFDYQAIARLRDGASVESATSDLDALLPRLPDEFPGRMNRASIEQTHMHVSVRPLATVIAGDVGGLLWIALSAALFVLLVAATNVAGLLLVRAESRRQSFAVARALGASAGVVLLEFFCEGLLIALAAGTAGAGAAWAGIRALQSFGGTVDLPRLAEAGIDATVLAVTALLTIVSALIVGGLPALRAAAASALSTLSGASRSATPGRDRLFARRVLVVTQVALGLVLLAGAGLMARSMWRLRAVELGFTPSGALAFRLALPTASYPDADAAVRFYQRALDRLATVPGVQAAGAVSKLPLDEQGRSDSAVFVEDRPVAQGALPGIHPLSYVTPGYFAAADIRIVSGRGFAPLDPPRATMEVIVSRAFAERYWGSASPLGRRLRLMIRGPWYTVVGVAADVHDRALDRPADQMVYTPILPAPEDRRWSPRDLAIVVRTTGDPNAVLGGVRQAVRGLDAGLPIYGSRTLADVVSRGLARRSFTLLVIGCASAIALLLGAIGLYGVMSYAVTLRTREIGIRLALGAAPAQVRRLITREGLAVGLLGVAIGIAGAVAFTRFLGTLLFEVSATDPQVFVVASLLLLSTAAAASWLPARRAARVDPSIAVRAD